MVEVGVEGDGTAREVVQLKAVVAEAEVADEGLRRRRLTAEEHGGGLFVPAAQHILHGLGHPRTRSGGMAVILGIAEILTAAVVLIQDLDVIQPALLKEGGIGLVQELAPHGRGGANVIALSLGGADLADGHLAVGARAHACLQALLLVEVHGGVVIHQAALRSVAKSRAVHAQHILLVMQSGLEPIEILYPAVGRPDEGRCPGSSPLPVHEDHHEAALGGGADAIQHGQGIGVGEQGIGIHHVGVVPAADGVGHDQRGILVPCGQGSIPRDLPRLGGQMSLKPQAVDLGGRLPAAVGGLPNHRVVGGKDFTEFHTAEESGLDGRPLAVAEEIHGLHGAVGIVEAHVQARVLPEIGHHLGGDHVGEQGVAPDGGVLGIPEAEVGAVALVVAGNQNTLVVGKQHLAALFGILDHQTRQSHAGEVHPLGKGILCVGVHGNTPSDTAVGLGQGHDNDQILKGGGEITKETAVFCFGAGARLVGGIVMGLPRLVAETDAEQGRGGGHTLHAVYDQRGDMSRGEIHGNRHTVKLADTHKALLGGEICNTSIVPHIGEIIKREDRLSVNFHLFFLHMAKSILTNPPNPSIIMVIKFALRSAKKEIHYDSVPIPLSPHGPGPL